MSTEDTPGNVPLSEGLGRATAYASGTWVVGEVSHKKQRVDIDHKPAHGCFGPLGYADWKGMARTYVCDDDPETGSVVMLANARLIAAAPDLLAALQELRYACTDKAEAMADAAIAKALGVVSP